MEFSIVFCGHTKGTNLIIASEKLKCMYNIMRKFCIMKVKRSIGSLKLKNAQIC